MRVVFASLLVLWPLAVEAGSRELEVTLVRVDTASDKASKACWRQIAQSFKDYDSNLGTRNRSWASKRVKADEFAGLSGWPEAKFKGLRRDEDGLDALVLVRCDAPARIIEVVVLAGYGGDPTVARFRLGETDVTRKTAKMLSLFVRESAYIGFSP